MKSRDAVSFEGQARQGQTWLRVLGWAALAVGFALMAAIVDAWAALGTKPRDARLARVQASPQYRGDKFVDTIPRIDPDLMAVSVRWFKGVQHSRPAEPLPVLLRHTADFAAVPDSQLRITWFGHSTVLVELEASGCCWTQCGASAARRRASLGRSAFTR
jgi:hypothetical protein